jgi:hypothetical protein
VTTGLVGIGVTPETWSSNFRAIQLGRDGCIASQTGNNIIEITGNAYHNSGWKYINSDTATKYYQYQGAHVWENAASGTADASISFSERMRIDSSGRLLVGTSSSLTDGSTIQAIGRHAIDALRYSAPTGNSGPKIQLSRSASNTVGTTAAVSATDDLGEINFAGATSSSTFNQGAQIRATVESGTISSTSLPTRLTFHTTSNGAASATERMRISANGVTEIRKGTDNGHILTVTGGSSSRGLTIDTGAVTVGATTANDSEVIFDAQTNISGTTFGGFSFRTGGGERLRIQRLGGISFNGDTAAANALDDYEEGSWTPVFTNAGTLTYSIQVGRYTKIGNLVHATCHLDVNAKGSASGNLRVGGLPFTSLGDNNYHAVSSTVHGTSWSTARRSVNILLARNATATDIYHNMVGTTVSSNPSITGSDWGFVSHDDIGTGNLLFSITYQAA